MKNIVLSRRSALLGGFALAVSSALARAQVVGYVPSATEFSVLKTGAYVGMANANAAIRQAITDANNAGGGRVVLPGTGSYAWKAGFDDPIAVPSGVYLDGAAPFGGPTRLSLYGSSPVFTFTGANRAGLRGFAVEGSGMTGGCLASVLSGTRIGILDIVSGNLWRLLDAKAVNQLWHHNSWHNGVRGETLIRWYGDDANRSDVLDLEAITASGVGAASIATAIDWDGNCHTLAARGCRFTNFDRGLLIRKQAGATAPAFLFAEDLEFDYPAREAIRMEAGADMHIDNLYAHGSRTEHNIYVAAGLGDRALKIGGAKISGAWKAGINAASRVELDGHVYDNSKAGIGSYGGVEIESGGALQFIGGFSKDARQSYGVIAKAGAGDVMIAPVVDLRGNATADFLDTAGTIRTGKEMTVAIQAGPGGSLTWNAMPAAATLLPGATRGVMPLDLRRFSQARLVVNRQGVAGATGAKLATKFNVSGSFAAANFNDLGTAPIEVGLDAINQVVDSGWVNIAAAARVAKAYIALVGYGGDGTASPSFGAISIDLR
ncbi:hypothetical protein VH570_14290 [Sphingobium sp. HT1-2]|uniref:hypothetical protein n=1 Tax=Sphingobium sp. HT1-2 TaxID=3111640 RepID=UPI003C10C1BA